MKPKKIDVVYVIGTGSKWNDNELRFSLRSICQNLTNVGKVFIVGECPDYLENIIHIPAADIYDPAVNADGNIITKVLAACEDKRLSETFLFINDDHLVIKPLDIADVPPLHKGSMDTFPPEYWSLNFWRKRLMFTKMVLINNGLPCFHFDCHTPILMEKEKFKSAVAAFDYQSGIGFTMKSLYGNSVLADKGVLLTNQKETIFKHYKLAEIQNRLLPAHFMSFNDQGLNDSLKMWLITEFPNRCKYENNDPQDRIFDIFYWQQNGKQYSEGLALFKKHFKNKNLLEILESKETQYTTEKLNYKILHSILSL